MKFRCLSSTMLSPDVEGSGGAAAAEPQTFSLEYVRELRAENKAQRLKAAGLEASSVASKTAADKFEADFATLAAKGAKDIADAVSTANTASQARLIRAEMKAGAAAAGLSHADFLKLIDTSAITVDKDGEVVVPTDFWTSAKTTLPHLFALTGADKGTTSATSTPPTPSAAGAKKAADMTPAEYKAARARIALGIVD